MARTAPHSLLVTDEPDRAKLRDLQATLDALLDEIAGQEMDLDEARLLLARFEREYESRMRTERAALTRVEGVLRHLERWAALLHRCRSEEIAARAERLSTQRDRETRRLEEEQRRERERSHKAPAPSDGPAPSPQQRELGEPPPRRDEQLKSVYRTLVRRCHPDLAQTEDDRVRLGALMARINGLYAEGDIRRLERLLEQTRGAALDETEKSIHDRIKELEGRLSWLSVLRDNLRNERDALAHCATGKLVREVEEAHGDGRDLLEELRLDLQRQALRARGEIHAAIRFLEEAVHRYNKQNALSIPPSAGALERVFDPYDDKRLVRLGLEQLAASRIRPAARRDAEWLTSLTDREPAHLCLILMTYAAEFSPTPLPGLETYDDIALRFRHLAGESGATLDNALVDLAEHLEYGLRRTSARRAHAGLRFRSATMREAIPAALRAHAVRRTFKAVLSVLDERVTCSGCQGEIFGVPLFRTRGLDDMRSLVCPECGHTLKSYWMPMGKDVQAILNDAFVDLELVSEWSLRLARTSVAFQLVDAQVETLTVGDLAGRLFTDIFDRNELGIARSEIALEQGGKRVAEDVPLTDVDERAFSVTFAEGASVTVADAVEILRHRIRNRFRPEVEKVRTLPPPKTILGLD